MADKKCKSRLFVGEGEFSYTWALVNKHSDKALARAITATEYSEPKMFYHTKSDDGFVERTRPMSERIEKLRLEGVAVQFNVDATKIDRHFAGRRFQRIHWNCPYRPKPTERENDDSLMIKFRQIVPNFFRAASELQSAGDRVHVSLMQQADEENGARQWENPIVLAAALGNYRLTKKRKLSEERYPGYLHVLSIGGLYDKGGVEREFVFEKLRDSAEACPLRYPAIVKTLRNMEKDYRSVESIENELIESEEFDRLFKTLPALKSSEKKRFVVKKRKLALTPADLTDYQYECSTDDDSSDYYESSDES